MSVIEKRLPKNNYENVYEGIVVGYKQCWDTDVSDQPIENGIIITLSKNGVFAKVYLEKLTLADVKLLENKNVKVTSKGHIHWWWGLEWAKLGLSDVTVTNS